MQTAPIDRVAGSPSSPRSTAPVGPIKVTAVEAVPFVLPYREPLRMAAGDLLDAQHVLIRIRTDAGLVGQAEAPARPMFYGESLESITSAVTNWFAPQLIGRDPFAVNDVRPLLDGVVANNTAKAAIDMALHDIRGQAAGVPVHRVLGGEARPVRVTHMLGHGQAAAVAEEAAGVREAYGISSFKVKVGYGDADDLAVVSAVRDAVGPSATIYVDVNQAYEPDQALVLLEQMRAEHGIAWVEEPVKTADVMGRRRVGADLRIPVLVDESCPTLTDVAREMTAGAAQYVSIKVARTGFTESADIAGLVTGLGGRVLLGSQGDSGIGTLCSVAFASASPRTAALPGELSYFLRLTDDLLAEPPTIVDGHIAPRSEPGLGIVVDEEKLAHYRTDR